MSEQPVVIRAPISQELLTDLPILEAYIKSRFQEALEREVFGGLTMAEFEDRLLYGDGSKEPMGIIRI